LKEGFLTGTEVSTVANIVTIVTEIVEGAISWMGSFVQAITSNELLLFFVVLGLVGLGVGLIKRIIRL